MRKVFRNIFITMALGIGIVVVLAWMALDINDQRTNFNRVFSATAKSTGKPIFVTTKNEFINTISGVSGDAYYFQNFKTNIITKTDHQLNILDTISFKIPAEKGYFDVIIDSPLVWIFEKNAASVIQTDLKNSRETRYKFYDYPYTRIAPVTNNTFAFRGVEINNDKLDQRFFKSGMSSNSLLKENNIFPKSDDGGIEYDGWLKYDGVTNSLVYIPFYKNEIIRMDTSLNLMYKVNTVDKFTESKTTAGLVDSGATRAYTNTSPIHLVNKLNCICDGQLYNLSASKADNEENSEFANNSVIDVYDIETGRYIKSFYIPKYKDENIFSFQVTKEGKLIVLYAGYIAVYKLS